MQLTLLPLAVLAATASAQGWVTGQQPSTGGGYQPPQPYQQPGQYQGAPSPPGGQGGSWSYQTTYNQPPPQPARQFQKITDQEADDWRSCTNSFLQSVDRDESGSGPACNFWSCLHIQASKWNRGGLLTGVSNVLNPICTIGSAAGHVPFLGDVIRGEYKTD
ncbi:hypothetical protein BKA65DRAFT_478407 [Rhexocercosporidium sp. MPI-PUGE-AT-0058]|nr:hypothetical protein BKA65DRAFT_478407 [Rhexocercosporidium sp. MPI-PUGE-AT-0058]